MTYWNHDQVLIRLREQEWDVVGMTVLTVQRQAALSLCKLIRKECPRAFIVLGGAHPTLMWKQVVTHWDCDAVVLGEGEITLTTLIEALSLGKPIEAVRGIAFLREDGSVAKMPARPVVENLDELPFPCYEDFDLNSYALWTVFHDATRRRDSKEAISIVTSRGCIARCTFCSTFMIWRPGESSPSGWRGRSPKHVVDEIELLNKEYGKRFFNIADDVFTVDEERVIGICRELIKRKLDVVWDCETRANLVSREMLTWMKRAGCHSVAYGVESFDEGLLSSIRKGVHTNEIYNAFQLTKMAGIKARAMLMIGNPGENESTIEASCRFIEECRPDTLQTALTMILPGTHLYHWARRQGFIDDDYWLTDNPPPYNTVEHSYRLLQRWEGLILMRHAKGLEKMLRRIRLIVESHTGVNVTKSGLELFRGDDIVHRLSYPSLGRRLGT
jgi:radical SAM superfamily enzyme YgiQ (UPF0313 family)